MVTLVAMAGLELAVTESRAERVVLRLGDLLGPAPARLAAPRDSRRVPFACEADWTPRSGSELHLFFEHSADVDPNRSFLSVSLNGGTLRSLRLDETNQGRTELVVPLPSAMFRRRNDLVVSAEQVPSASEESEKAWTLIAPQSYVSIDYEPMAMAPSLRELPAPLVDPLSDRPPRLAVLLPVRAAPATLEAIGVLVAALASRVAPKAVTVTAVHSPTETGDALVVVGTVAEQPTLRELSSETAGTTGGVAGVLAESHGRRRPVLYVTAESPAAVARAARDLLDAARQIEGASGAVPLVARSREIPLRGWPGFAPPRSRFALSELDLGPNGLTLSAEARLDIPIRVTPDARFLSDGQVTLVLTLLPEAHQDREARLDVEWNGVVLASVSARRMTSPTLATSVRIPRNLLRQENRLALSWKSALPAAGRPPLASVAPATELYLPRDYEVRLPDLALLQASLYPFSLRADLSDVIVVLPDGPSDGTIPLLCELAALLGRVAPSGSLAFRVRSQSGLSPTERASAHLIVLETVGGPPIVQGPAIDWQRLPGGRAAQTLPMIQELVSPWNAERFVLRFRASSATTLLRALRGLGEPYLLSRLAGDTAFLGAEGPTCYRVGPQRIFEEVSYVRRFEAWLQTNWLVLPLIVAVVSGGLFLALRLALGHYRALRSVRGRPSPRTS